MASSSRSPPTPYRSHRGRRPTVIHLTSTQHKEAVTKERQRRRLERILQVREQSKENSRRNLLAARNVREQMVNHYAAEVEREWQEERQRELLSTQKRLEEARECFGMAHRRAQMEPDWESHRRVKRDENLSVARHRGRVALSDVHWQQRLRDGEERASTNLRNYALMVEKERTRKILSKPLPKTTLKQTPADVKKQPCKPDLPTVTYFDINIPRPQQIPMSPDRIIRHYRDPSQPSAKDLALKASESSSTDGRHPAAPSMPSDEAWRRAEERGAAALRRERQRIMARTLENQLQLQEERGEIWLGSTDISLDTDSHIPMDDQHQQNRTLTGHATELDLVDRMRQIGIQPDSYDDSTLTEETERSPHVDYHSNEAHTAARKNVEETKPVGPRIPRGGIFTRSPTKHHVKHHGEFRSPPKIRREHPSPKMGVTKTRVVTTNQRSQGLVAELERLLRESEPTRTFRPDEEIPREIAELKRRFLVDDAKLVSNGKEVVVAVEKEARKAVGTMTEKGKVISKSIRNQMVQTEDVPDQAVRISKAHPHPPAHSAGATSPPRSSSDFKLVIPGVLLQTGKSGMEVLRESLTQLLRMDSNESILSQMTSSTSSTSSASVRRSVSSFGADVSSGLGNSEDIFSPIIAISPMSDPDRAFNGIVDEMELGDELADLRRPPTKTVTQPRHSVVSQASAIDTIDAETSYLSLPSKISTGLIRELVTDVRPPVETRRGPRAPSSLQRAYPDFSLSLDDDESAIAASSVKMWQPDELDIQTTPPLQFEDDTHFDLASLDEAGAPAHIPSDLDTTFMSLPSARPTGGFPGRGRNGGHRRQLEQVVDIDDISIDTVIRPGVGLSSVDVALSESSQVSSTTYDSLPRGIRQTGSQRNSGSNNGGAGSVSSGVDSSTLTSSIAEQVLFMADEAYYDAVRKVKKKRRDNR